MDKLVVKKSLGLNGEIRISGAKNAVLPIVCAGILTAETLNLTNVPHLKDIDTLGELLRLMGIDVSLNNGNMLITANKVTSLMAPYELVKQMRASILVLGPLLKG